MSECVSCGQEDGDLRMCVCWDCADAGEQRVSQYGVVRHVWEAARRLHRPRSWWAARISLRWAWERLTRTGDYAPGGTFEREYGYRP